MTTVKCSNCGKEDNLLFRGDNELRVPYGWRVIDNVGFNTTDFELLCNEDGCWNKEDKDEKYDTSDEELPHSENDIMHMVPSKYAMIQMDFAIEPSRPVFKQKWYIQLWNKLKNLTRMK